MTLMMLLALAGCGGPSVTTGIVISRNDEPSFTTITSQCMAYDGKTGACTISVMMPHTYPEEWSLCLRDDTQDRPADKQDTGCVSVAEADYERYSVGDHYP